jgi:hypothetical protein
MESDETALSGRAFQLYQTRGLVGNFAEFWFCIFRDPTLADAHTARVALQTKHARQFCKILLCSSKV